MAVKLGNGNWAVKEDKLLAYNDNSGLFFNKEFDFSRGSTATYVGRDGLIATAASDTPRIDFTNDTKGHLLLEPSSTNLVTQSDGSNWLKSNVTYTANTTISPDGSQNAATLDFSNNNGIFRFITASGDPDGRSFTGSVYLKAGTMTDVRLRIYGSGGGLGIVTKQITLTDEWQRFDVSQTFSGTGDNVRFRIQPNLQTGTVYFYGGQVEELSHPTSLIYTTGAASTRNADVCNNSGSAQDFNSEEGVLYAEIAALADDGSFREVGLSDNTVNTRVVFSYTSTSNRVRGNVKIASSSTILNLYYDATDVTDFIKVAVKFKSGDYALWVNGVERATNTTSDIFAVNELTHLNFTSGTGSSSFMFGKVRNVQVFTEALTDEQLQKLTS